MCVSSAVPLLSVRLPFWCRRPRPLLGAGQRSAPRRQGRGGGERMTRSSEASRRPETISNCVGGGREQGRERRSDFRRSHASGETETAVCEPRLPQKDSEKGRFSRRTCGSPPAVGGKLLGPPCNQMWPYLGRLPAVVPASYDGWFISVRVFQYAKLNLTILNLVSNELGNPWGYGRPNGWTVWTGVSSYLRAGTNFCNLIWQKKIPSADQK